MTDLKLAYPGITHKRIPRFSTDGSDIIAARFDNWVFLNEQDTNEVFYRQSDGYLHIYTRVSSSFGTGLKTFEMNLLVEGGVQGPGLYQTLVVGSELLDGGARQKRFDATFYGTLKVIKLNDGIISGGFEFDLSDSRNLMHVRDGMYDLPLKVA